MVGVGEEGKGLCDMVVLEDRDVYLSNRLALTIVENSDWVFGLCEIDIVHTWVLEVVAGPCNHQTEDLKAVCVAELEEAPINPEVV